MNLPPLAELLPALAYGAFSFLCGALGMWIQQAGKIELLHLQHNADLTEQAEKQRQHFSAHLRRLQHAHAVELALQKEAATTHGIEQFQWGYRAGALRALGAVNHAAAEASVKPPAIQLPRPWER